MTELNNRFRGKNAPTNVLSFPAGDGIVSEHNYLGDIALGFEICKREAHAKAISMEAHASHLVIHGLLHLAGYDHQTENDANEMEKLETEILITLGIANPYMELNSGTVS